MPLFRIALVAFVLVAGAAVAHAQQAAKATLLLNWYFYAEHAPFFLGKDRGYFRDEGIDLDIQEGRGSVPTVQAVANGTADFGYADLSSIAKGADKGAPVKVVGVLLQRSPMAFIALTESGIKTPQDLRGKRLALTPGDSVSQVLPLVLRKVGLKESDMSIVSGDSRTKINAVINGQSDAMIGYSMDQNLKIAAATKKPVTTIPFTDSGVNLASSSVVVSSETVEKRSDLVTRFMRAASRAVSETAKDPDAAIDAMLRIAPKAGDRTDLIEGLKLTIPLYHTDDTKGQAPFRLSSANYKDSMALLAESGNVSKALIDRENDLLALQYLPK